MLSGMKKDHQNDGWYKKEGKNPIVKHNGEVELKYHMDGLSVIINLSNL